VSKRLEELAAEIRWDAVPYFHGKVLEIGHNTKTFPHWIEVNESAPPSSHWAVKTPPNDLSLFASKSVDAIFSCYFLHTLEKVDVLDEWVRVLKQGGHLMLYLPKDFDLLSMMRAKSFGWNLVELIKNEESTFYVFKIEGKEQKESLEKPEKTCAVIRYGAIGDMIQMSSILPWLKSQGYWIDLYCQSGAGYEVVKHDPHVDRFIIQGKDEVPPQLLSEFWDYTKKKYNKWVNLCESVESTLLPAPGSLSFSWPNELRAKYMDRNYIEWTHDLAQVPPPYKPKFHSTAKERERAKWLAQKWGRKNILWSLSGSSGHKAWPHVDSIIASVMLAWTDVHVVLVGDDFCKILEVGWEKEKRVHCKSGEWSIRETLAFAEQCDLVIGTETGVLNAAGSMEVPKIIVLSHSSKEMLTKHWKNTVALSQPKGLGCNKHPCRQLHGGGGADPWLDCPRADSGASLCQENVTAAQMWPFVLNAIGAERMAA
jgi:ADP-heptose:LPS heptosyltransferase